MFLQLPRSHDGIWRTLSESAQLKTSNMTSVNAVRSASACFFGVWRPLVSVITTLVCCHYFSLSSAVSRTFSALCVYSKFGHHPHPLGYLYAKFRFFRNLHCWASLGEKPLTQSLNNSLTQLIWCPKNRSACAVEFPGGLWVLHQDHKLAIPLPAAKLYTSCREKTQLCIVPDTRRPFHGWQVADECIPVSH